MSRRSGAPTIRPRRLRRTPALRRLVAETVGAARPSWCCRCSCARASTEPHADRVDAGRRPAHPRLAAQGGRRGGRARARRGDAVRHPGEPRTPTGSGALDPDGILNLAITDVVAEVGDALTVMSDLCLDEFTDHGHCGVLDARRARSTTTARSRCTPRWRCAQAAAGVDMVGPSGMMDGQVARRSARRSTPPGTPTSAILAYSAKYASAFYGPFREAVDSSLAGRPAHLPAGPRQRPRGRPRGAARRRARAPTS